MKKILMILMTLVSFGSFAEDLVKEESIVKEEKNIETISKKNDQEPVYSDEIIYSSEKFIRLKKGCA